MNGSPPTLFAITVFLGLVVPRIADASPPLVPVDGVRNAEPECDGPTDRSARVLVTTGHSRDLQIAVAWPQDVPRAPDSAWRLVEVDHPQTTVPVQIAAAGDRERDGADGVSRDELLAIIPPRPDAGDVRRFRLEPSTSPPPSDIMFAYRDVSPDSIGIWQGEQSVLVYNHGMIVREDVPANDSRRRRACYIHPVWGLNGEILTDDFPKDHFHHHGVFWAWPHVGIDGREYDLWEYRNIQQRFVRWLHRETGPLAATLAVENGWFVGDTQVMIERVGLRVFRASETARAIDVSLTLIPIGKPVTLRGAEGKSYGGLTARFAPGPRQDTRITVPTGIADQDLPDTPLPWADFTSKFAGAPSASGAAVLVHPGHPDFPPTWLTRYYGPLCVGWPGVEGQTFPPGHAIQLRYRLWVHKSAVELSALNEAYQAYVASTTAVWDSE